MEDDKGDWSFWPYVWGQSTLIFTISWSGLAFTWKTSDVSIFHSFLLRRSDSPENTSKLLAGGYRSCCSCWNCDGRPVDSQCPDCVWSLDVLVFGVIQTLPVSSLLEKRRSIGSRVWGRLHTTGRNYLVIPRGTLCCQFLSLLSFLKCKFCCFSAFPCVGTGFSLWHELVSYLTCPSAFPLPKLSCCCLLSF